MHPQAHVPYFPLIPNPGTGMWGPVANVYSAAHLGMHQHDPLARAIPQHPIPPNQIKNNTIIQHPYQLVYPPYPHDALPVPVRRWQHVTQNTRALPVHRCQHVTNNGNQISRVQNITLVPNTAMGLPTPYQPDLAHSPSYGPLTQNSFYFPAPAMGVPIRTLPYMAHSSMFVPTVSLPHRPLHFRYALNNTYLSPTRRQNTPTIGNPASTVQSIVSVPNIRMVPPMSYQPRGLCSSYGPLTRTTFYFPAPGTSAPIRTPPYPNMPVPTVSVPHQPPHFLHTPNNTNLYPRRQHTPVIGGQVDTFNRRRGTQLTATSARQENEIEENTELALLLNLPKDESVFYEWWKFTSSSSLPMTGNAPN